MSLTPVFSLPLRVVQLDLARQMETLDFIKSFADHASANGFNALALYLEARVRTASFPYPSEDESYSPEQIREIVEYAEGKGMEVIPVVSTLGHAQLFLRHPEMVPLAETRPPFVGRFGPGEHKAFCPSQAETHAFLKRYLAEIAELFPSDYFHIGCDETWDMACCDLCSARLAEGEHRIFSEHIRNMHAIVSGELGKRVIIWDDMVFQYPEILSDLPRDIVMACWQYQNHVNPPTGHFFHKEAVDLLSEYDRLGFDYLICPADYTMENAESFTAYAAAHRPLGGWLTLWEKHELTPLQSFPLISAVGRFWASGKAQNHEETFANLFGLTDGAFLKAIRAFCRSGFYMERLSTPAIFLTQRGNSHNHAREELVELLLTILPACRKRVAPASRDVLEEILLSLRGEQISNRLAEIFKAFWEQKTRPPEQALQSAIADVETLYADRMAFHQRIRPGISIYKVEQLYNEYLRSLRELPAWAASHGFLKVHFFLADQYSAQTTRISIRYSGESQPTRIAQGVFKEIRHFDAYYSRLFPIDLQRVPEELIIETWGYGGQGFTWFEANNEHGRHIPSEVRVIQGIVKNPEWLLRPDWKETFTGERDARVTFLNHEQAKAIHCFHVALQAT